MLRPFHSQIQFARSDVRLSTYNPIASGRSVGSRLRDELSVTAWLRKIAARLSIIRRCARPCKDHRSSIREMISMVSIPIDSYPFDNDDAPGWEIKWWPSYTKHLAYVAAFQRPSLSLQQQHLTSCAFICEHPYLLYAWFTFINFNFLPIASRNFVLPFRRDELAKFIISRTI